MASQDRRDYLALVVAARLGVLTEVREAVELLSEDSLLQDSSQQR